jgi:hypothetical protein
MGKKRVIDSRDKKKPVLVFKPHPECQVPHFSSPMQVALLERAVRDRMELDVVRAENQHLKDGCEDEHCPWCWLAQREAMIRFHARARVVGERLARAERALRQRGSQQVRAEWEKAQKIDLEEAITAEQDHLRELSAAYLPHYPWSDDE